MNIPKFAVLWSFALVAACTLASPMPLVAQETGTVIGRVTGETGQPLDGVQVMIVGTSLGTVTDADGRYTIPAVPAGSQRVRASLIGYGEREETVAVPEEGSATVNFSLEQQALELEGVVAVGYGTQERRDVTGSVVSIDVDDVQTGPVTSLDQVLQGRAPGVQVTQNSGSPGGGVSIQIRGARSLTASNQPLYVIDGVPAFIGSEAGASARTGPPINPLAALSPNDIESIEILKDASATAIYGSRGANGVVLITTKRGTPGQNVMRFQSSYGMQDVTRTIPMLNARQYAELAREAYLNADLEPPFTAEEVASFDEGTDWQEQIFRSAPVQNHALTVSGGDERTQYLVTGSVFDQEGIIKNSGFRRYSARLNLDREVSDRFRIGNSLALSRTGADIAVSGGTIAQSNVGAVIGALWAWPTHPVRQEDGTYTPYASEFYPYPNPVATALEITNERTASRVVGNVFGEYDLTDALRFRTSLGGNAFFQQEDYYAPTYIVQGENEGGDASRSSLQSTEVLNENILTYDRPLRGDRDDLDLTAGFTVQTYRLESVNARAQQFSTDVTGANALGAGALPLSTGSGTNEWTLLSWLGRANYSLADKYLFTLTGRYDGSSKFGGQNKWGFFPSGAFAWRVSSEPFLEGADWISDLKLRTSYGVTGNQEIGTYNSLARLGTTEYELGGVRRTGYFPAGRAPNPDLRWESTAQFDVGADLALFNQRVTVTADYYRSVTDDLLLVVPLPSTTGFASQLQNIGSVSNRGVELGINTINVERDNFTWSTRFNIATNRNEVVALGGDERRFAGTGGASQIGGGGTSIIQVGEPLGTFYGYETNGIWQIGDECPLADANECTPGEYRFVDVNGDGVINSEDRTIIGSAQPDFYGGITNNFTFGPLSLDVFLNGSYGGQIANMAAINIRSLSGRSNETLQALERWTPENPSNTVPRANLQRARQLFDVFIEDGSYLRLQNVTLGYQLPERLIPGVQQARLYVSGQNLWTWTDYTGYDPEVNSFSQDPGAWGVDIGAYPRARTINLGVDATF